MPNLTNTGIPATSSSNSPTLNAAFVLNSLRRWWLVAAPIGIVLGCLGAAFVFLQFVPMYRSNVTMRITEGFTIIGGSGRGGKVFVANQLQLIRSPMVLDGVVSREDIARLPELADQLDRTTALGHRLSIKPLGRSEYFSISYTGPNPKHAARIAQAVADSYLSLHDQFRVRSTERLVSYLEGEKRTRALEIRSLRDNVKELAGRDPFSRSTGPIQEDGTYVPANPIAQLHQRIVTAKLELSMAVARVKAKQEELGAEKIVLAESDIKTAIARHPRMAQLEKQLAIAREKLRTIKDTANQATLPTLPSYKRWNAVVKNLNEQLEKAPAEIRPEIIREVERQARSQRQSAIRTLAGHRDNQALTVKVLEKEYRTELGKLKKLTGDALELEFRRGELVRATAVLDLISDKIRAINTNRNTPPGVEIMAKAKVPASPTQSMPFKNMGVVALGCFGIPFLLALAWEFRIRRICDSNQIERSTDIAVVGEIATLPVHRLHGNNSHIDRDMWLFEESIDSLRTGIVLSESMKDLQVVAVTSAAAAEGKTSVAAQLAVSIARSTGDKTLLIDGDMRSPDLHNIFEVELEPGLSELLQGQTTLDEAVTSGWSEHLDILAAGELHASPHKLVGGGRLENLMREIRDRYRYVVIDTPPVLAAGESLVLAKAADVSLVCAMRDVSRLDQVRTVFRRLSVANANPVGVVLSGVPARKYAYTYGYYGYSRA